MVYRESVKADAAGAVRIADLVREHLEGYKKKESEAARAVLCAEEAAVSMGDHAPDGAKIDVRIRSFLGSMTIELACPGEDYEFAAGAEESDVSNNGISVLGQGMIRDILLKNAAQNLKYRHQRGINRVTMTLRRSPRAFLFATMGALILGILVGLLLSWIGAEGFNSTMDEYVLVPIKTMYMNALKMVVAPVVFFSIVSCISRFSDLSELGRIGGRVMLIFLLTMVLAVGIGIGSYFLFTPGEGMQLDSAVDASSITSKTIDVSIKDMIVGIVPSDIVNPFLTSNMLQLIFMAVMCGIAAGKIGKYSEKVKDAFEALNDLFLKITAIIIKCMPVAIFCSICSLVLGTGMSTIASVLGIVGAFLFALCCMILIYCVLLRIMGGGNPITFLKSYAPTMLQTFSMASSSASIPLNMKASEKLGVSKKVYSLAIPMGATVNMDGTCIFLSIFALAIAKMYGVELTAAMLSGLIVTIMILSVGAPGIPGSGLICLSVLLTQMNIPTEAVGLVMGIDALLGMFRTMANCTGDVVTGMIVDGMEKRRQKSRRKKANP